MTNTYELNTMFCVVFQVNFIEWIENNMIYSITLAWMAEFIVVSLFDGCTKLHYKSYNPIFTILLTNRLSSIFNV